MKNNINITSSILISKNIKTVFDYLSDLRNDEYWRDEANGTKIDTEYIKENTIITQDSFLSKKVPHYDYKFRCTQIIQNQIIICETIETDKFWCKNLRQTQSLNENSTKVIYQVQFSAAIIKYGLGFNLPSFIITIFLNYTINKYLKQLKHNLEK